MPRLIEAIDIKRKMFFEFEDAPYHCLDVDISKPTARGGTHTRLALGPLQGPRALAASGSAASFQHPSSPQAWTRTTPGRLTRRGPDAGLSLRFGPLGC